MHSGKQHPAWTPLSQSMSSRGRSLRERIAGIREPVKRRPKAGQLLLLLLILLFSMQLVSCQSVSTEPTGTGSTDGAERETGTQTAGSSSSEGDGSETAGATEVPVIFTGDTERVLEDPMKELSEESRSLLRNIPAAELPREIPDHGDHGILADYREEDLWRGLLLPLCADSGADVTLYGVCAGDVSDYRQLSTDGIVLRCGNHAAYQPLDWSANAWYAVDPWMQVADLDGDGANEIAICLNLGGGTGTDAMQLYIFEMDTLQYSTVDLTTLAIEAEWDPEAGTITLTTEGEEPLVVDIAPDPEEVTSVNSELITEFEWRDGQIWFQTCLDTKGNAFYFAQAEAPVIWSEDGYRLGQITLKPI